MNKNCLSTFLQVADHKMSSSGRDETHKLVLTLVPKAVKTYIIACTHNCIASWCRGAIIANY